jgi:hypothetical protein
MRDRVRYRLLNIYMIQYSIGRDNVAQLQVLNPPLCSWYCGQWGDSSDENHSAETVQESCQLTFPMRGRSGYDQK